MKAMWPFNLVEGRRKKIKIEITLLNEKKQLFPEQISSIVLERLKKCAEQKTT